MVGAPGGHFEFTRVNIEPTILRKKIEDVMNVKGIGEKSFLKLKPLVTVAIAVDHERRGRIGPPQEQPGAGDGGARNAPATLTTDREGTPTNGYGHPNPNARPRARSFSGFLFREKTTPPSRAIP
jgi:hypothetical protein